MGIISTAVVTVLRRPQTRYRGWRLDLLSYRVPSGWRPFVLIKGPKDVRVPDAPRLLSHTFPSNGAADDAALKAATEWIDKRSDDGSAAGFWRNNNVKG